MHFINFVTKMTAQQRGNELCIQFFVCVIIRVAFLTPRSSACAKPLKTLALKTMFLRAVKAEELLALLQN